MNDFLRELVEALKNYGTRVGGVAGAVLSTATVDPYEGVIVAGCDYKVRELRAFYSFDEEYCRKNHIRWWKFRIRRYGDTRPYELSKAVQHVLATIDAKVAARVKHNEEVAAEKVKEEERSKRRREVRSAVRSLDGSNLSIAANYYDKGFTLTVKHNDSASLLAAADCLADNGFMVHVRPKKHDESDEEYQQYVSGQYSNSPKTDEVEFLHRRMRAAWDKMTNEQRSEYIRAMLGEMSDEVRREVLNALLATT